MTEPIEHTIYMKRALELARKGLPMAMPNPMVGAVIVNADGEIIGEGYHRKCGEPHAEVNAIASVADQSQLQQSTMYVTLEPCAHYGRTGPCAKLIIEKGIPNVVVGCRDPFDKVDGKGIEMLKDAGVNVTLGVLEQECKQLNAIFFTAHTQRRPFIILKWAQSADGYMDTVRQPGEKAAKISNDITSALTHQLRAVCDGILVGSGTVLSDDPSLTTRLWPGKSPRPIILDCRGRVTPDFRVMDSDPVIINEPMPLEQMMRYLYDLGFTSVLVEGGAETLQRFIDARLFDLVRVETSSEKFGKNGATKAPELIGLRPLKISEFGLNIIEYYSQNPLIDVKNL